ncbi:Phosphoinositide phospholipase C 6 [Acorus calamus]|uniref:Phosphoinositide phospholipase C 6 n=1 Tax=Acorus calamus TaxID=4465 RepID=A0AAV9C4C2_ACOCL|nr:Phosphoinositide phospholipase C 6 [Acorus calamus]
MGAEQLKRFLVEVQGEEEGATTKVEVQAIIDSVLRDSKHQIRFSKKGGGSLGLDGFFRYLFEEANPPISPSLGVHHDMTAPLSHYFIYTSHNTYLTGNQLNSDCSDVPIIEALKRGMVTQIFGDLLFYPMLDGMEEFPSPEQLKMQIILSTKPPKEYRETKITTDKGSGSINAKEDEEEDWGKEVPYLKSHLDNEDRNDRDGSEHIHDEEDHDDDDPTSNKSTAPEYKRLITIHDGTA